MLLETRPPLHSSGAVYDCWVKLVDTSGLGSLTVAGEPDWLVLMRSAQVTVFICDTTVIQSLLSFQTKQRNHSSTWSLSRLPALCDKEIKWKRKIGKDCNAINVDDILLRYTPPPPMDFVMLSNPLTCYHWKHRLEMAVLNGDIMMMILFSSLLFFF